MLGGDGRRDLHWTGGIESKHAQDIELVPVGVDVELSNDPRQREFTADYVADLRACCALEAEPYIYRGLWDEAVQAAEEALPVAWKIGEWDVVFFSSGWLAIAYLKLGQPEKARGVLDRVFNEAPARIFKVCARDPVRAGRTRSDPFDYRSI